MILIWLSQIGHHPGYYKLAIIGGVLAFTLGVAYVPWMASFTETVEAHNPALTATGLAIWGWIIRVVVFIRFLILPAVINTVTPLVNYGAGVQAAAKQYPTELAAVAAHPQVFAQLAANPSPANIAAAAAAVGPQTLAKIVVANKAPGNAALYGKGPNGKPLNSFQYALVHGTSVANAAKHTKSQWKTWYWICFAGTIFFLLTVPIMRGRWSPKKARQDEEEHELMVQGEMEKLHIAG
jgi:hypothetical protein